MDEAQLLQPCSQVRPQRRGQTEPVAQALRAVGQHLVRERRQEVLDLLIPNMPFL